MRSSTPRASGFAICRSRQRSCCNYLMKELRSIIQAFREARSRGEQCALATVVQVSGSAYRRPGARMLVTEAGRTTGSVSGGCLETDVLRKARLVLLQRTPALV